MVTRTGRFRKGTRNKLSKNFKDKGKLNITRYLASYKEGDRVVLVAEPAVQKSMFFPRFHGKAGIIQGKKGRCYVVKINDGGKKKTIVTLPIHLKKQ